MFSLLCSVKQKLGNYLAREKELESELVGLKELYERRLCEAQERILTLKQELNEQKINCKCRNPRWVHDRFCPLFSPDEEMLEAGKLMSQAKDAEISLLKARSEDNE